MSKESKEKVIQALYWQIAKFQKILDAEKIEDIEICFKADGEEVWIFGNATLISLRNDIRNIAHDAQKECYNYIQELKQKL